MTDKTKELLQSCMLNFMAGKKNIYLVSKRLEFTFDELIRTIQFETLTSNNQGQIFENIRKYILLDPNYKSHVAEESNLKEKYSKLIPLANKVCSYLEKELVNINSEDEKLVKSLLEIDFNEDYTQNDIKVFGQITSIFNETLDDSVEGLRGVQLLVENTLYFKRINRLFEFLGVQKIEDNKFLSLISIETKNSKLKIPELAFVYYLYFRARGFVASEIKRWYSQVVYRVYRFYDANLDMAKTSTFSEVLKSSSVNEKEEFNIFTQAFFQRVERAGNTGQETIHRYIQYSDSKSTIFNCNTNPKEGVEVKKLNSYWTNFINLEIEYNTQQMQFEFDNFILDPKHYLRGE